jgi:hypothetical protein
MKVSVGDDKLRIRIKQNQICVISHGNRAFAVIDAGKSSRSLTHPADKIIDPHPALTHTRPYNR